MVSEKKIFKVYAGLTTLWIRWAKNSKWCKV